MECDVLLRGIASAVLNQRRDLGLTQKQLASMAGVSERSVRSLEAGKARGIGLENLVAILAPLGLGLSFVDREARNRTAEEGAVSSDARAGEYERLLRCAVASWSKEAESRGC